MPTRDPRVDAYIAKAPAFARPILEETRARVRKGCPQAEETIKWNVPFFLYDGRLLASMAAFKAHTKIGVWNGMKPDMVDVGSVADLPAASAFVNRVKAAAAQIAGAGSARAPATKTAAKAKAGRAAAPAKRAAAKSAPKKSGANASAKRSANAKKSAVKKAK